MVKKIKHILVADDDEIYRDIAQEALEKAGNRVTVAADGGEAMALLARDAFDLAIIDLNMPVADGITVIEMLRKTPVNANVPVIVITGHDDAQAVERAYLAGAASFLTKPLNWLLFTPHVDFVLRSGQTENDLREATATAAYLSDLKSQMMAALAKEFQSPIKTIFGFSELIQKEVYGPVTPPAYKGMLTDVGRSAHGLNTALLKLMDFGRTLNEHLQIKFEPVKAREALIDAISALEPGADRREIRITPDFMIAEDVCVDADRALLSQALRSILDNAVRMSPRGAEIKVRAEIGGDGCLSISVSDNGPAMPQDLLHEVNGRPREAASFANQAVPNDVSIKIAKILTEAHQGQLTIKSDALTGNVVRLSIPRHKQVAAAGPAASVVQDTPVAKDAMQRLARISAELAEDPRFKGRVPAAASASRAPFPSSPSSRSIL